MHTLRLLGGASLEVTGSSPGGRTLPRTRLALLALLALARTRTLPRERLVATLWPEAGAERARHLLRDAAYRLRDVLGDDVLVSTGDDLKLDASKLRCDVWAFEDAAARDDLAEADGLYAGPFLDGFFLADSPEFEQWAAGERRRLAAVHARVLESLAMSYGRAGDWPSAIAAWRRLAAAEPHNARVVLRLMEVLDASGDRAAALRQATAHAALLAADLGAEPDVDVAAYAERLRRAPASHRLPPVPIGEPAPDGAASAPPGSTTQASTLAVGSDVERSGGRSTIRDARTRAILTSRMVAGWIGVAALAVVATGMFIRRREAFARTDGSVTVLAAPVTNPDSSSAYLAAGLMDEVTAMLAKHTALDVRLSRAAGDGVSASLRDVARELGVRHVVTLAVRRTGERTDVIVNLTRVRDGRVLWSDTFRDEAGDLMQVSTRIAHDISAALTTRYSTAARGADVGTTDPAAWDAYLQGKYFLDRRGAANLRLARARFDEAVALDPGFARAHAGKAMTATLLTLYDGRSFSRDSMLPAALAAAERAIALDGSLSDAHAALGQVLTYRGRDDWARAEIAYREAVTRDPRNANAHGWLAELLIAQGRTDEAIAAMERATDSDPLSGIQFAVRGNHLRMAGRFDEAIRSGERALQLNPAVQAIWEFYGRTLFYAGLQDSAVRVFAAHAPRHPLHAYFRAATGDPSARDSARRMYRQWESSGTSRDGTVPPPVALALAGGDASAALDALERAVARNPTFPLHNPLVDHVYDAVRDSVRFREIVGRAGLDLDRHLRPRRVR